MSSELIQSARFRAVIAVGQFAGVAALVEVDLCLDVDRHFLAGRCVDRIEDLAKT